MFYCEQYIIITHLMLNLMLHFPYRLNFGRDIFRKLEGWNRASRSKSVLLFCIREAEGKVLIISPRQQVLSDLII